MRRAITRGYPVARSRVRSAPSSSLRRANQPLSHACPTRSGRPRLQTPVGSGAEHRDANKSYFEDGVMLLELARTAGKLFREQEPNEQRRLFGFVLSNSSWKDGELTTSYRKPFDIIAESARAHERDKAAGVPPDGLRPLWLPVVDTLGTFWTRPIEGLEGLLDPRSE